MKSDTFESTFLGKLGDFPGVYFFLDKEGRILYIGKATSLRDRVRSYFSRDLFLTRGPKIVKMLEVATDIRTQRTDSVLEALFLEAELIRKHQPPYNTDVKDDKSWNMVVITREKFPRVLVERGRHIGGRERESSIQGVSTEKYEIRSLFGPFPSGNSLKEALKIVRKLFPYRDTCEPHGNADPDRKPCFHAQIGLCPGACAGLISAREYQRIIRNIELFFSGKKSLIVRRLEREMKEEAKQLRFERAHEIKKTIFALSHIQDVAILSKDLLERGGASEDSVRIEGYDVAHLGGEGTVGVMTVVENGRVQRDSYRKFIIRSDAKGDDLRALEELLRRRLGHAEWKYPSVVVVDGSHLQRRVAERVLAEFGHTVPVLSVIKDKRHRPKDVLGPRAQRERFRGEALLVNAEAHRFSLSFHRKRRRKNFLSEE